MMPNQPQPGESGRQRRSQIDEAWRADQINRGAAPDDKPVEPLVWQEMAVQVVHNDYLECKLVSNDATYGVNIKVAKDPGLRKSLYHGLTIGGLAYDYTGPQSRTVTDTAEVPGTADKAQVVIPKYHIPSDGPAGYIGEVITVGPIATDVKDDSGDPLHCQYREFTQRAWANDEGGS